MADALYLLDSNILIRWIQPRDPGYITVQSALDILSSPKRSSLLHIAKSY